ncbi:ATP-dependent RecD-like DNA helicase [Parasutterella muris]|uniref:ATP-dependent DNA helicase n=2 Tax=Parasutterella TaxID=577310 RepID=UPI00203D7E8A|nr:AAA family ATPase [Parasutterella muris]
MIEQDTSYEALTEIILGLTEAKTGSSDPQLRGALTVLLQELTEIENKGGLCLEWKSDDEKLRCIDILKSAGLIAEGADLDTAHPYQMRNVCLFVADRSEPGKVRIYSHRSFFGESRLAANIAALAKAASSGAACVDKLDALEAKAKEMGAFQLNDGQRQAASLALQNNFSVICGGPGTGKTTSVVRFLEVALQNCPEASVTLCAPTGKAKSRLNESVIYSAQERPDLYPLVKKAADEERIQSLTIHKLLGTPLSNGERPSRTNPLETRILIIDEGSMVDEHLADSLFSVIDPHTTKTVVLGDKHQLAAVGPGSVFADISDSSGPLSRFSCELTESKRFKKDSLIHKVATHILNLENKTADLHEFEALFEGAETNGAFGAVGLFYDKPNKESGLSATAKKWLEEKINGYAAAVKSLRQTLSTIKLDDAEETDTQKLPQPLHDALKVAWNSLSGFRPICAQRRGAFSLDAVNRFCDQVLRKKLNCRNEDEFYVGKVIIVRKNDPSGISNGDVCILLPILFKNEDQPSWYAYVGDLDRLYPAMLLPSYDTAFGITIHQSQGSGFDDVAVFLPPITNKELEDPENGAVSLCTRELLYTGFTRAKKSCLIFGSPASVELSLSRVTERTGGLQDRLREKFKNSANP